jgi:lipid-A-disaccharide synthase
MAQLDVDLIYHLQEFSAWGYSGVIAQLPFYLKAMNKIEAEVINRDCKVAILIDFQTFNLKLARRLAKHGVKILYYVAPQAWAWKSYRVAILAKTVHTLFTIIPFEKEWFNSRGVPNVESIDHPIWTRYCNHPDYLASIKRERTHLQLTSHANLLLLPGSRNFEVKELLPEFLTTARKLKRNFNLTLSLVKSPNVAAKHYLPAMKEVDHIYQSEQLSSALGSSDLALAASGTVTLTAALFQVPTVVCYQTSLLNQWIYETFVDYNGYISLANIVLCQQLFPELVAERATSYNMVSALTSWMSQESRWREIQRELKRIPQQIKGELQEVEQYLAKEIKESR